MITQWLLFTATHGQYISEYGEYDGSDLVSLRASRPSGTTEAPHGQQFFSSIQSIQGDLGSWFGYDFDLDDDNERLFIGAPKQPEQGAVYLSDYDLNEWTTPRKYHHFSRDKRIKPKMLGSVVRSVQQQLIVCDPLLQLEPSCKSDNCSDISSSQFGACFTMEISKILRSLNQRSLPSNSLVYPFNRTNHAPFGLDYTTVNGQSFSTIGSSLVEWNKTGQRQRNIQTNTSDLFGIKLDTVTIGQTQYIVIGDTRATNTNNISTGGVFIVEQGLSLPEQSIYGECLGEQFGTDIVITDLDGDGFPDLVISAPTWSSTDCIDCGRLYVYRYQNSQFVYHRHVNGLKNHGRLGTSLALLDIDGNGIKDVVVSAPFGKTSSTYVLKGDQKELLCDVLEPVLSNRERLFGWRMRPSTKSSSFYAPSLFISSPLEARVEQFFRSDGYTVNVTAENLTVFLDPIVAKSVEVSYCVTLQETPFLANGPFIFRLFLHCDEMVLSSEKLDFKFNTRNETLCRNTTAFHDFNNDQLTNANITILGGDFDGDQGQEEDYYDQEYSHSYNSDASYSSISDYNRPLSLGCLSSLPVVQIKVQTTMLEAVELVLVRLEHFRFSIEVKAKSPIISGRLILRAEDNQSIYVSSQTGRKWSAGLSSTWSSKLSPISSNVTEVVKVSTGQLKIRPTTVVVTFSAANSKQPQTETLHLPIIPSFKVREALTSNSDSLQLNSEVMSTTMEVISNVAFTLPRYELVIALPSCFYDPVSQQWRRFAAIQLPLNSSLSCEHTFCDIQQNKEPVMASTEQIACDTNNAICDTLTCFKATNNTRSDQQLLAFNVNFFPSQWLFNKRTFVVIEANFRSSATELSKTLYKLYHVPRGPSWISQIQNSPHWVVAVSAFVGVSIIVCLCWFLARQGFFKIRKQSFDEKLLNPVELSSKLPHIKVDADLHAKAFLDGYTSLSLKASKKQKMTEI